MGCTNSSISRNSTNKSLSCGKESDSISTIIMPSSIRTSKKKQQQQQPQSSRLIQSSSSRTININFLTIRERNQLANGLIPLIQSSTKLLLSAPFSNFSQYTRRLFLTGFAGIIPENINNNRIGYIIILAKEMANITMAKDKTMIAGMSRSATIVLAYAIKHLRVSLRIAFQELQQSRQCARPNPNYFQQLIGYEHECLDKNSVHMIDIGSKIHLNENDKKRTTSAMKSKIHSTITTTTTTTTTASLRLPDIYRDSYPELLKYEQNTHEYLKTKSQKQQSPMAQSSVGGRRTDEEYTGELRPYIIEHVFYWKFFHDIDLARQQHTVYVKEKTKS
ncbi:dual specificity protein phosphatase 14-like [Dermatophagoides farinae]|uniref:Dual specificity protein phosphatase 14-like n=1 Tax=Dermatophagoides farinae TaxID=6954 RepID=A0A9D4NY62_DERFA|nr:dual specificity protein phosphatase 14-like [Dermatophagoides farinae]